jgi:hypothetical protein
MISIRNDGDNPVYNFPQPFELAKRLKDILETNVDEKYYLKQEQVDRIVDHCNRKVAEGCGFKTNFTPPTELAEQSLQNAVADKPIHLLSKPMNDGINTDADGNSRTLQANYYKQNYYNFEPTNSRNATAVIEVHNAKESN